MKCPSCGNEIEKDSSFCGVCGQAVPKTTPENIGETTTPLNADIAALICIFFGSLGCLDYYANYKTQAYVRFFINFTVIGIPINLIWNIVNFYQIGKGTYRCANGQYLDAAPWAFFPFKILHKILKWICLIIIGAMIVGIIVIAIKGLP